MRRESTQLWYSEEAILAVHPRYYDRGILAFSRKNSGYEGKGI